MLSKPALATAARNIYAGNLRQERNTKHLKECVFPKELYLGG